MPNVYMSKVSARVPRQGWPKPQKLAELGDKKSVLEFLMDEWNAIADFQRADAPALVAYLTGDKAIRQERVADAFRSQAAMAGLEKLYMEVSGATCHDSEWWMYQVDYDVIGHEADLAARAGMKALESMIAGAKGVASWDIGDPLPSSQEASCSTAPSSLGPEHAAHVVERLRSLRRWAEKPCAPKVEVGQLWHYRDDAAPLTVDRIEPRLRASMHDCAVLGDRLMWLDDEGHCARPQEWRYVGEDSEEPVAIGQVWRWTGGGIATAAGDTRWMPVIELHLDAKPTPYAVLDNGRPHPERPTMSLTGSGRCRCAYQWERAEDVAMTEPQGPEPKVAVLAAKYDGPMTAEVEKVVRTIAEVGQCWVSDVAPREPVKIGQVWQWIEPPGPSMPVIELCFSASVPYAAHLEDRAEEVGYEMELTPEGYPEHPERWRLVSDAP